MYKLMVVAGPNRGAAYSVQESGETSIGRQSGNTVVLASSRVSKKHCVLVTSNGKLVVHDQGSSNGTFVNGVLAKEKNLKSGDRISVGEFVFEVIESKSKLPKAAGFAGFPQTQSASNNNLIQFPSGATLDLPGVQPAVGVQDALNAPAHPRSILEKAMRAFDNLIMPFFYGLSMKNEWRLVSVGILAAFCVANMFISIAPLLEGARKNIVRETERRAAFMAHQLADFNSPLLAGHAESRMELGSVENADGVKFAAVTDLDIRILAPLSRQNQYLTTGSEALLTTKARDAFRNGRETGIAGELDSSTVIAIEPLKAFNQATGKNMVIGMAIVSIDTTLATMGIGDIGLIYSETIIITVILGAFALLVLYRLTLKPLQLLGDDMDKALKGDMGQVTHEFKFEELNPLWDLINSALQRIPRASGGFGGNQKTEPPVTAEDFSGPLRALAGFVKVGLVVFDQDKKIVSMNAQFEELSGIREDSAVGQEIGTVARDQAFAALTHDLFERVQAGGEGSSDDFEFSGISYRVHALAFGSSGTVKCYILVTHRAEDRQ
jgi:PAS domain-containing protein